MSRSEESDQSLQMQDDSLRNDSEGMHITSIVYSFCSVPCIQL